MKRWRGVLAILCGVLFLIGAVYAYLWNSGIGTDASVFPEGEGWICRETFSNQSVRRIEIRVETGSIDGHTGQTKTRSLSLPPLRSADLDFIFPRNAVSSNRAVLFTLRWNWTAGDEKHEEVTEQWLAPER